MAEGEERMKMKKRALEEGAQRSERGTQGWPGADLQERQKGARGPVWEPGQGGGGGRGPHPGHSRLSCLLRILSLHGLFLIQCNREGNTMVPKWV